MSNTTYPVYVMDTIGPEEIRAIWYYCGIFPHQHVKAGRRACRRYWRERGLDSEINEVDAGWDMLHIITEKEGEEMELLLQREMEDAVDGHPDSFCNLFELFEADDWYLEIPEQPEFTKAEILARDGDTWVQHLERVLGKFATDFQPIRISKDPQNSGAEIRSTADRSARKYMPDQPTWNTPYIGHISHHLAAEQFTLHSRRFLLESHSQYHATLERVVAELGIDIDAIGRAVGRYYFGEPSTDTAKALCDLLIPVYQKMREFGYSPGDLR